MAQKKAMKTSNLLKIFVSILLMVIFVLIVIGVGNGYAKFNARRTGSITARVPKMICNMTAIPSDSNSEIVDPYCVVTVCNYNILENNNIERTEVSVQYKLEVVPQSSTPELAELPSYRWEEMDGTLIQEGGYITDTLTKDRDTLVQYKVVFDNPETANITAIYDIKVTAVQDDSSQA